MRSLQLPLRAGPAALLLVLCLQLGLNKALENPPRRKVLHFHLDMPRTARPNEEVSVKLELRTELRECMVVRAQLRSNVRMKGHFNQKFTGCLCEDNPFTFFWDFYSKNTAKIAILIDVINEKDICDDISVVPNEGNQQYIVRTLFIH
ncbi:prolactin-inducible protein homolog [Callospermophilus lateralis]